MSGWSGPRTRSRSVRVLLVQRRSPRRAAPPPGRRRRGCCGRSGCRGGRGPGPARSRRGCARAGRSPRPAARRLVGDGEVVARGQGVGVVGAQDPLAVGEGALVQGDRLGQPPRRPGRRRRGCCGMARVSGWSGPRTRSQSVRARSDRAMRLGEPARRPGRRRRGCCARSGCRGGRGRGPARGRRGCARTGRSPRAGRRPAR